MWVDQSPLREFVGVPGLCAPGNPVYWSNGAHAPNSGNARSLHYIHTYERT